MIRFFGFALVSFGLFSGCATYQSKVHAARNSLRSNQVEISLPQLELLANQEGGDQLVHLLDYATALHISGDYSRSNEVFLKADQLIDQNDYYSVTRIAGATLGSEEMLQYKGESYEKLFVPMYMALNFLMLKDLENALVSLRRLNDRINKFRQDGRENYELNPFAHYLQSVIWEASGDYDNAYIALEKSYNIDSSNPFLGEDLIRLAKKARRPEAQKKWQELFPSPSTSHSPMGSASKSLGPAPGGDRKMAEVIFIFQQGWGPFKGFSPVDIRFPKLYPDRSLTQSAQILVDGYSKNRAPEPVSVVATTKKVYDVEAVVTKTLDDDYAALVARKIGAVIAKEVVADQIRQKDKVLGDVAWLIMQFSDRADLRQWSFLPQSFQISRVQLKPGKYQVMFEGVDGEGNPTGERSRQEDLTLEQGQKYFLTWRSVR